MKDKDKIQHSESQVYVFLTYMKYQAFKEFWIYITINHVFIPYKYQYAKRKCCTNFGIVEVLRRDNMKKFSEKTFRLYGDREVKSAAIFLASFP